MFLDLQKGCSHGILTDGLVVDPTMDILRLMARNTATDVAIDTQLRHDRDHSPAEVVRCPRLMAEPLYDFPCRPRDLVAGNAATLWQGKYKVIGRLNLRSSYLLLNNAARQWGQRQRPV